MNYIEVTNWTGELVNAINDMWVAIKSGIDVGSARLFFVQIGDSYVDFAVVGQGGGQRRYELSVEPSATPPRQFMLSRDDPPETFPDAFDLEVVSALARVIPHWMFAPPIGQLAKGAGVSAARLN